MAKFCTKCGKQLEEGEVCSCSAQQSAAIDNANAVQNNVNAQPVVNGQAVQQTASNVSIEQTKNFLVELWNLILNIFRAPVTAAAQHVRTNDILSSIILFVIQGIVTGIAVNTFIARSISEITNGLDGIVKKNIDLEEFNTVIVVLLISVALSFAYAAVLMLASIIFKGGLNFMQCVRIMGARSVFVTTGTVVAIIIALLSASVGLFASLAVIPVIGIVYVAAVFRKVATIDDNKLVYLNIVYILFAFIVYYIIVVKIGFVNLPLVKNITKGAANLTNLFGDLSSGLGSLFN